MDDLPYIVGLGMDIILDLHKEYTTMMDQYQKGEASIPIHAFFGDLISRPPRRKAYPIALLDRKVNLDQLLAINNAMKYPVAYIQGPPGTGKTSTIVNTIMTAFFYNKKYYHSRLDIKTNSTEPEPLVYVEIEDNQTDYRNTAPAEVEQIVKYAEMNQDKDIGVITPFVHQKEEIERHLKEKRLGHVTSGTVHAFQGDEKDVVLFSTAITDSTQMGTYEWLKNNKELINVATSRAKEKLMVLCSTKNLERLHQEGEEDDLYELVRYVKSNGTSHITRKDVISRALGVKPFSTETEEAFLMSLNHALENIWLSQNKFVVEKEVAISHVFQNNLTHEDLFYSGRFDFVVYEKRGKAQIPVLAIELDGKEHFENEVVKNRDKKKNQICRAHNMELIRIENSYARRYHHIKEILNNYFSVVH